MHYQILANDNVYEWNYCGTSGTHFSKDSALRVLNKLVGEA